MWGTLVVLMRRAKAGVAVLSLLPEKVAAKLISVTLAINDAWWPKRTAQGDCMVALMATRWPLGAILFPLHLRSTFIICQRQSSPTAAPPPSPSAEGGGRGAVSPQS